MDQQARPNQTTTMGSRSFAQQPRLGQTHTAEGRLDLSAVYVVHHALRRDLRDFDLAVPATPLSDTSSWKALGQRWGAFKTAMHHHMQVEDVWMWPQIRSQLTDGAARQTLDAMSSEHRQISSQLDVVASGFTEILISPGSAAQTHLSEVVRGARQSVLAHLAREETDALPLAQTHLTTSLWKAAQTNAAKEYGLADLRFAVPWSAREVPADQFGVAFAHGGVLIRILLALTRGGFDRRHRTAFRHIPQATTT
jgi:hemerythrin-like domain-containing protein